MAFRSQITFTFFTVILMGLIAGCPTKKPDAGPPPVDPNAVIDGYWLLKVVRTAIPNQTEVGNYFDEKSGRMVRFAGNRAQWYRITEAKECAETNYTKNDNKIKFDGSSSCVPATYDLISLTALEMVFRYTEKFKDKEQKDKEQVVTETYSRIDKAQWDAIKDRPISH